MSSKLEGNAFCTSKMLVSYAPRSLLLENSIDSAISKICDHKNFTIKAFENEEQLNKLIDNDLNFTKFLTVAIIVSDDIKGSKLSSDLPNNLEVTIRLQSADLPKLADKKEWYTNEIYPKVEKLGPRTNKEDDTKEATGGIPNYENRGFLHLQQSLTFALMNNGSVIESPLAIRMNRFPYPRYLSDSLLFKPVLIILLLSCAFLTNYDETIQAILTEKEKQLTESMKIMGLPLWLHWVAWFTISMTILFVVVLVMTCIFCFKIFETPIIPHASFVVVFLLLILYSAGLTTLAFLISVFFNKANTGAIIGQLVFLVTFILYLVLEKTSSLAQVIASCLLINTALGFGISCIIKFEANEEGLSWDKLWSTASSNDSLTLGAVYLMICLDTLLHLLLAWYIEAIFPGEFGVPQPWYFPFTRAYWCNDTAESHEEVTRNTGENFEEFTENRPIGIQLQNLSRTFGMNRAVKELNLEMYEGHITVLLGHNGAGKTTTMSMITGMIPPTSGTVIVNGHDVRRNRQKVREIMGLCLQHNVLFDLLTVYEHFYFFCTVKGLSGRKREEEIKHYIDLLELQNSQKVLSEQLSGGMKRKVGIGQALCGDSKVVILDEPTAGMDPSARRAVWNVLLQQKKGRTILLTTHFMEEADLLGDRIAIMTSGTLQCCGSSFFLKRKFGTGYHLIIDITPDCNPSVITSLLRRYIPSASLHSYVGSELTYLLSDRDSDKFTYLLRDLEMQRGYLGIKSFGISVTTLEEVFLKVGAENDNQTQSDSKRGSTSSSASTNPTQRQERKEGLSLMYNQFLAIILKKSLWVIRSWMWLIFQILVAVGSALIILLISGESTPTSFFPSLKISLDAYETPVVLLQDNRSTRWGHLFKNTLEAYNVTEVSIIKEEVLTLTSQSPSHFRKHYIVAASFDNTSATAWFNGDLYHSTPLALGLVLNTVYKDALNKSITFTNHPLPLTFVPQVDDSQSQPGSIAVNLSFGMAFVTSCFILFYIKERVCKAKHQQFVSGMNVIIFWITAFLCDLVVYLVVCSAVLITLAILQEDSFRTSAELGDLLVLLICFGLFVLPFVYLCAYLFKSPSSGLTMVFILGYFSILIVLLAVQMLEAAEKKEGATMIKWIFLFTPFYCLAKGVADLERCYSLREACTHQGKFDLKLACAGTSVCCGLENSFAMTPPGIGINIVICFTMSVILFGVLIFNEYGVFHKIFNNKEKEPPRSETLEEDVEAEKKRLKYELKPHLYKDYGLVMKDLTKYYKKQLAVNGLCLAVTPNECFGLLGVNGAGKTTTFKMITGDEQISYGGAWVKGHNVHEEQKAVQRLIGYCPQFDAIFDEFTARETLKLFSLIRGFPCDRCRSMGEELAQQFGFTKHLDKKVQQLSGGNKRKLSTAIALIGDPPVIYLDEPSTGMDPGTKRLLWTALAKVRDSGKCIILTSHSMEECEALCTRIAIMVNGNFRCLGSTQRLKNKFAQGFQLTIKIKKYPSETKIAQKIGEVDQFVKKNFPGAELKERYQDLLSYQLGNNDLTWSKMFETLNNGKRSLGIVDYSLGQCSLEQVFLSFSNQ